MHRCAHLCMGEHRDDICLSPRGLCWGLSCSPGSELQQGKGTFTLTNHLDQTSRVLTGLAEQGPEKTQSKEAEVRGSWLQTRKQVLLMVPAG